MFIFDLDKTIWNFTVENNEYGALNSGVYDCLQTLHKNNILCIASKGHYHDKSIELMKHFKIYDYFKQIEIIPSDNKPFPFNTTKKRRHFKYIDAIYSFNDHNVVFIDDNVDIIKDVNLIYPSIQNFLYVD